MKNKTTGFDLIRSFAVFFVFISHILYKQSHNEIVLLIRGSISPGLTMSALGFISAYLLTYKHDTFNSVFYIKRFSRIYSSLTVCLLATTVLHIILSFDVINQHSIFHFMGLTFFLELFEVANKSSIGQGLWFISVIILMYLLLPLMTALYRHKHSKFHLIAVILACLFFNHVMYNTGSAWNVVIAFNIGCYIGNNSNMESFTQKPFYYYLFSTFLLLSLVGLATSRIIPHEVRSLLYPFFTIPLLYKVGNRLKGYSKSIVTWFSSISYEFYILHFYFINEKFSVFFPSIDSISSQIFLSFIIVLPSAYFFSKIGNQIYQSLCGYLLAGWGDNNRTSMEFK